MGLGLEYGFIALLKSVFKNFRKNSTVTYSGLLELGLDYGFIWDWWTRLIENLLIYIYIFFKDFKSIELAVRILF